MATLKLEKGGPAVAMLVQKVTDDVSQTKGQKAQYKFTGKTAADPNAMIWLFTDTAERQFARIGLSRETIIGRTVEFSRTADGYYDIHLPAGTSPNGAPTPTAAPAPTAVKSAVAASAAPVDPEAVKAAKKAAWERVKKCYAKCFDAALEIANAKLDTQGWDIPLTHDGIAIMADTLFSHCKQEGVV